MTEVVEKAPTVPGYRKLRLNFPKVIPEVDLLGAVMGPDMWGGRYYVQTVFHTDQETTECNLYPLPPGETRVRADEYGQIWVTF